MLSFYKMLTPRLGATLLFGAVVAPWAMAQTPQGAQRAHSHEVAAERLGSVEFKVECNTAAQGEFNRAMALYHSFWWRAAAEAFGAVTKADPTCGMAHWGRAMVILDNPFTWPANLAPKLKDVSAALEAARSTGLKSQREKDFVEAVAVFVRDHEKVDHQTRLQAYEQAMAQLAQRYPDDSEAAILSALVTSANFNSADKTYANQLRAAGALERFVTSNPNHPGVAHYMIHSYDYPPIAKHGVAAARKYATIAPESPHAQHMPSHIFTRLGYWRESIEANRASSRVANDATFDGHHAHDYLVYAHLQIAQDRAAREALERSRSMKLVDNFAAAYAYAAMPARLALERSDWKQAEELPLTPADDVYPWKKYPQAEAVNAFARAIGAARRGNAISAREQQARLLALRGAAEEAKLAYWVEQIDIQAEIAGALALCAEGKAGECIEGMRKAAAREDAAEKHVVTPGPILPARELLADLLLASGQTEDALQQYEAVLSKEPNRYRAVLGAARAATRSGDESRARDLFKQLAELGKDADSDRDGLEEARQSLSRG